MFSGSGGTPSMVPAGERTPLIGRNTVSEWAPASRHLIAGLVAASCLAAACLYGAHEYSELARRNAILGLAGLDGPDVPDAWKLIALVADKDIATGQCDFDNCLYPDKDAVDPDAEAGVGWAQFVDKETCGYLDEAGPSGVDQTGCIAQTGCRFCILGDAPNPKGFPTCPMCMCDRVKFEGCAAPPPPFPPPAKPSPPPPPTPPYDGCVPLQSAKAAIFVQKLCRNSDEDDVDPITDVAISSDGTYSNSIVGQTIPSRVCEPAPFGGDYEYCYDKPEADVVISDEGCYSNKYNKFDTWAGVNFSAPSNCAAKEGFPTEMSFSFSVSRFKSGTRLVNRRERDAFDEIVLVQPTNMKVNPKDVETSNSNEGYHRDGKSSPFVIKVRAQRNEDQDPTDVRGVLLLENWITQKKQGQAFESGTAIDMPYQNAYMGSDVVHDSVKAGVSYDVKCTLDWAIRDVTCKCRGSDEPEGSSVEFTAPFVDLAAGPISGMISNVASAVKPNPSELTYSVSAVQMSTASKEKPVAPAMQAGTAQVLYTGKTFVHPTCAHEDYLLLLDGYFNASKWQMRSCGARVVDAGRRKSFDMTYTGGFMVEGGDDFRASDGGGELPSPASQPTMIFFKFLTTRVQAKSIRADNTKPPSNWKIDALTSFDQATVFYPTDFELNHAVEYGDEAKSPSSGLSKAPFCIRFESGYFEYYNGKFWSPLNSGSVTLLPNKWYDFFVELNWDDKKYKIYYKPEEVSNWEGTTDMMDFIDKSAERITAVYSSVRMAEQLTYPKPLVRDQFQTSLKDVTFYNKGVLPDFML